MNNTLYYVIHFEEDNTMDVMTEAQIIYDGKAPVVGQRVEAAYKTKNGKFNLYQGNILFISENTYDVRKDSQLIYEGSSPVIGQVMEAAYKIGGKTSFYNAIVLFKSEDNQEAEEFLSKELEKECTEDKGSEGLGRGKRAKKRKMMSLEEEVGLVEEKKKKEPTLKDLKKKELLKLQKVLMNKDPKHNSADVQKTNVEELLHDEIKFLKNKNEKLEADLKAALDLGGWLEKAKELASLCECRPKTLEEEVPPPPPYIPTVSPQFESPKSPGPVSDCGLDKDIPDDKESDNNFNGLIHKGPSSDVVELVNKSNVFISRLAIHSIKITGKTHSHIARALLSAVFDEHSLANCSLTGKLNAQGRQSLNPRGVMAIFDASTRIAKELGLTIEDKKTLTKALGTRLSEIRKSSGKKAAAKD